MNARGKKVIPRCLCICRREGWPLSTISSTPNGTPRLTFVHERVQIGVEVTVECTYECPKKNLSHTHNQGVIIAFGYSINRARIMIVTEIKKIALAFWGKNSERRIGKQAGGKIVSGQGPAYACGLWCLFEEGKGIGSSR